MAVHIKGFCERLEKKWQDKTNEFCFVWLFYPQSGAVSEWTRYDYLYGSIVNSFLLKDYARRQSCCPGVSFAVITPSGLQESICKLIGTHFDLHVTYDCAVEASFLEASEKTWSDFERQRWGGVMNKLYLLHPDIFGCYKKIVYLDSDMFILSPCKYFALFHEYDTPAGVYERANLLKFNRQKTHILVKEFTRNQVIPAKYCKAGTKFYHCVNASLLILTANESDYQSVTAQLSDPDTLHKEQPHLSSHVLHFPEQEFLTNFFAGRWRAVDGVLLGTTSTWCQASGRFWENPGFDRGTGIITEAREFFQQYAKQTRQTKQTTTSTSTPEKTTQQKTTTTQQKTTQQTNDTNIS
jgi:hypothetical protein